MFDRAPRQRNDGLRKVCGCPRAKWPKCPHGWRMNFKWKGVHHRYALDRLLAPRKVRAKTEAETKPRTSAPRSAKARSGRQGRSTIRRCARPSRSPTPRPVPEAVPAPPLFPGGEVLTDPGAARERELLGKADSQIRIISRTELDRPDGERRGMGEWLVCDITTDTLEQFQAIRSVKRGSPRIETSAFFARCSIGPFAKSWSRDTVQDRNRASHQAAKGAGAATAPAAGRGGSTRRRVRATSPRLRRSRDCDGHAKGELLSLQWWQVQSEPRPQIFCRQ